MITLHFALEIATGFPENQSHFGLACPCPKCDRFFFRRAENCDGFFFRRAENCDGFFFVGLTIVTGFFFVGLKIVTGFFRTAG